MNISFYQLNAGTLEQALAKLLPKIYGQGLRCCVVLPHEERVEAVNTSLWTLGHGSFLPHGSAKDGPAENQPIWLTSRVENPNQAQVLILGLSGFEHALSPSFERCLIFFDGHDTHQISQAQLAWETYQKSNHDLVLWHQEKTGEWTKKPGF